MFTGGLPADLAASMAFQHWFGLERGSARVLLAMYRKDGTGSTATELARETGHTAHSMRRHHIPQIRQALDNESIDFDVNGYSLTDTGRAECLAAMKQIGEELTKAASFPLTPVEPSLSSINCQLPVTEPT